MRSEKWWENIDTSVALDGSPDMWYTRGIFQWLISNNKTLYRFGLNGYVDDKGKKGEELIKKYIPVLNPFIVDINSNPEGFDRKIYTWEHGIVEMSDFSRGVLNFEIKTTDPRLVFELVGELRSYLKKVVPKGVVKMLTESHGSYSFTDIGTIKLNLTRDNYNKQIVKGFEHLIAESGNKNPCGRFSFLAGPPGTGKSYFIRGLITEGYGRYIYVPSSLVGNLSGPSLVKTLFRGVDECFAEEDELFSAGNLSATTLIIEDADSSIRKRNSENVSKISDLLNLSDGLLGELADIRIIATTNIKIRELDEAIYRPGRLCSHLKFDYLSKDQYENIYKRETGKKCKDVPSDSSQRSLAALYKKIKNSDNVTMEEEVERLGQYI